MSPAKHCFAAYACVLCFSCGSYDDRPLADSSGETLVDHESAEFDSILHRFSYKDHEFTFHGTSRMEGDATFVEILLEESIGSIDYLGTLSKEHGALTSLEIFQAFAPAGMAPHPSLIAAHEHEAAAMRRTGESALVLSLDFENIHIDKVISPTCTSDIFPNIAPGTWQEQNTVTVDVDGVQYYSCAGSPFVSGIGLPGGGTCESHNSNKMLTVGICTDTGSVVSTEMWIQRSPPVFECGGSPCPEEQGYVSPGSFKRFTLNPLGCSGFFCATRSLAVIAKNSLPNSASRRHVQKTGVGVF